MGKRGPVKRKGAPTGVRLEPELRAQLEKSAEIAGRSLSEEITARLRASFGSVQFNDPLTQGLAVLVADALNTIHIHEAHPWHETQRSWSLAGKAIDEILAWFEPDRDGSLEPPDDHPILRNLRAQGVADDIVSAMKKGLDKSKLDIFAARLAIARCEAVAEGGSTLFAGRFGSIAEAVKQKLDSLGNAGLAGQDLKQDGGLEFERAAGLPLLSLGELKVRIHNTDKGDRR